MSIRASATIREGHLVKAKIGNAQTVVRQFQMLSKGVLTKSTNIKVAGRDRIDTIGALLKAKSFSRFPAEFQNRATTSTFRRSLLCSIRRTLTKLKSALNHIT
jgi:hypothetical protein